ncbi:MATE family efflux transporter [Mucilaginibacter daejeonensis]|uniref:MATE family efflux transporter n=1 Tax=Mucilaginibacter daejeonensis TaxID=398049 RepID=UPI001D172C58|nr:MATE family efflux transporter [Mucilaginibacter daejeonensis]UEG51520.1 MATE family efflux transporter [Mucilaginibacter daejeonensis]
MLSSFTQYRSHYRHNLKLAIPVVISQLGHTLVQLSDSVIVGHFVGTISLAAVSLVNSVFVVGMVMGLGISYGITPLIAQNNGQQNHAECGRLLSNSLFINLISGILLFVAMYFGAGNLLGHLKQSPEVLKQARPFMLLLSVSIIPMLIFGTFKQFAEGLGFTKQAMSISIWGNLLNICLGVIFVKGLFGIRPMGISGVGYATLIDRTIMAIVMGIYVFRSKHFKAYLQTFKFTLIDRTRCLNLIKIGAPVAMQYTFEVSAFSAAAVLVGQIGAVEQAAHQVAINLASLTYMMASGVSAAAAIRSGNYFGAKSYADLRASAIASYHIVLVFMTITALIFVAGNEWLPWIVTSDVRVISVASGLLIIAALFQVFDGTQVIGLGILRGMGDVNVPTLITFLAYWVVGLPLGYVLGLKLGLGAEGVWYGLVAGLAVASVLLYLRFIKTTKKHLENYIFDDAMKIS